MKSALFRCIGSLALPCALIAGCNNLIGADAPNLVSSLAGSGVGGAKTEPTGHDNAGAAGTDDAQAGSGGALVSNGGASGSAFGGSATGGDDGASGGGVAGNSIGGSAGTSASAGSGGTSGTSGTSGAPQCADPGCTKPPGAHCSTTEECQSGVCGAEGVCCNTTCSNKCTSCKLPNKPGVCSAIDFSTSSDIANCGSCGSACSASHVNATCSAGVCGGTCAVGYANCSTTDNDGCEVNTVTDPANCGGCGVKCKYGLCSASACLSTTWGLTQHTGPGEAFGTNNAASIIAVPVTIATNTKLAAIGLRAYPPSTTVHMYLSLFSSSTGTPFPSVFVAQTGLLTMGDITSNVPTEGLTPAQPNLPAGEYFVVIVSDNLFHVQDEPTTQTLWYNSASVTFGPLSAAGGIPASASMKSMLISAPDAYVVSTP